MSTVHSDDSYIIIFPNTNHLHLPQSCLSKADTDSGSSHLGHIGERSDAEEVSALVSVRVHERRVHDVALVPNSHGPSLPLDAGLEVLSERDVVVEEPEEPVALLLGEPFDMRRARGVDEQGLLARDGVLDDDGVAVLGDALSVRGRATRNSSDQLKYIHNKNNVAQHTFLRRSWHQRQSCVLP
jgi:hypothetical protein